MEGILVDCDNNCDFYKNFCFVMFKMLNSNSSDCQKKLFSVEFEGTIFSNIN